MNEALKKLDQKSCEDSRNVISSPALESGVTRLETPVGATTDLFGRVVAPVRVSQPRAKARGLKILATSGLVGLASSESQDLQRSLENRLIRQLDSAGSTLFKQTWKRRVTPLGRRYLEHTASVRRTSDNAFTSLPTPCQQDGPKGGPSQGTDRLPGAASLASVNTPQYTDYHSGQAKRHLNRKESHHGRRNNDLAMLATVPTPMAGMPAQKGYNEAGSTDYARKIVSLASAATPTSADYNNSRRKNPENELTRENAGTSLAMQAFLATVTTPTAQDHSRGNKPAREWDTGKPLSQQAALSTVPTPNTVDAKGGDRYSKGQEQPCHVAKKALSESGVDPDGSIRSRLDQLPRQAQLAATGQTVTGGTGATGSIGQLAPDYSRWLQGLPEEWASCADMVTLSVRRKRKHSSKRT